MEAVASSAYVQDTRVCDLPWQIDWRGDLCTTCGQCVATCTFGAIHAARGPHASVVIRQSPELSHACTGCGMCARVCPAQAIRPVRNPDSRSVFLSRLNGPAKRGGRGGLSDKTTLDSIVVGRISQMTDPALDADRHVFDMRAPLGRVKAPTELPLSVQGDELVFTGNVAPVRWIYPLMFSDMSIGALSTRAWEALALATSYLNEKCHLPVRMSTGEGGIPQKLLLSPHIRYMILQIASGHFGWNRILKALPKMKDDPAGCLIKIGQGAKPGDGGLLPRAKVGPHIQAIRGVGDHTLHSPANHQGLYSIEESVQKMHFSLNAAFGFRVPVAIKCAASATSVAVYNNLLRDSYDICGGFFLDGIQGGTGAANEVSLLHTGHPIVSTVRDCYLAAVAQGRQGHIPLWAGGGIGMSGNAAADAFKLVCLGANGVIVGKLLLQLMGCVGNEHGRCNACNTGKCPAGICTQDPKLVARLDVDRAAANVVRYVQTFDAELRKLLAPVGNSSLPVGRSDAIVALDRAVADRLQIAYAC